MWRDVSTRLLYAIVAKKGTRAVFLVGHAPHELSSQKYKNVWWDLFEETIIDLLAKHRVSWTILLNANARVKYSQPSYRNGLA